LENTLSQNPALAPKCRRSVKQAVKFQTVIPAKLNKKRRVSVLIPAKLLKIMVKVMEVNKGCIKYKAVLKPFVCIPSHLSSRKASANHGIARLP
jgi:hypothetical protein